MSNTGHDINKMYAAIAYANGVIRGVMFDAIHGKLDREELRQIYEATACDKIAESIGMKESELSVDWNLYLSEDEKQKIRGKG